MRIIRPYGRSLTANNETGGQQRVLQDKQGNIHGVPVYSREYNELVIAQWISTIDKIVTKPQQQKRNAKASYLQHKLRGALGNAAKQHLENKAYVRFPENDDGKRLTVLWNTKIHPYGETNVFKQPEMGSEQHNKDVKAVQGRWYREFAGNIAPDKLDAAAIANIIQRIDQHLYHHELRRGGVAPRDKGRIQARAESIANNVLKPAVNVQSWTAQDETQYAQFGDIAGVIHAYAKARLDGKHKGKPKRLASDIAGVCLREHWAKVFLDENDQPLTVTRAKEIMPDLFALHDAIRDTYTRVLKYQQKPKLHHLPVDMTALYKLVQYKQQNRELAGLVRLGKVLHYRQTNEQQIEIAQSRFWSSAGQAEIKRAEAFVRIWRHVIGQGNLALAGWASMNKLYRQDVLGNRGTYQEVIGRNNFDSAQFDKNCQLVLGAAADLFTSDDDVRKASIQSAIAGLVALRNTTFHFKKRDDFIHALMQLPQSENFMGEVMAAPLQTLWERSWRTRTERLIATLRGIHLDYFFKQQQVTQLSEILAVESDAHLPLPRFRRMLLRNDNTQPDGNNRLPPPANRAALEQPARKCQYTSLKLVYERAFRGWLENCESAQLHHWIDVAIKRGTEAAKKINARGDEDKRLLIMARAAKLPNLKPGAGIRDFFFLLSAETATEMRVQRAYESDGEKAQEQAAYIDDLLCDVVALAFRDYLQAQQLGWLLNLTADEVLPAQARSSIPDMQHSAVQPEAWQPALYFLLHLIPVGDVSQLLHQLAKWEITAGRDEHISAEEQTRLMALQQTLKLYLDMHDNQFIGSEHRLPPEELAAFHDFYVDPAVFKRVFPDQSVTTAQDDTHLPQRELREIRRFGHLPLLRALAGGQTISAEQVERCLAAETADGGAKSAVEQAQQRREQLHAQWVKQRKGFKDNQAYCAALQEVIKHRKQANWIRLTDHVRAHRLVLMVLTRLLDYAGLFERDLYFVTLAALRNEGLAFSDFFSAEGLEKFNNGQVIAALRNTNPDSNQSVLAVLKQHFGFFVSYGDDKCPVIEIRNALAHFNMLHSEEGALKTPLNLTEWVNKTRDLMAYDRKLKNAVSKSVIDLLQREGLVLTWKMQEHQLAGALVTAKSAVHLGGQSFKRQDKPQEKPKKILEALHSAELLKMVATAFGGEAKISPDISDLELATLNWEVKKGKPNNRNKQQGQHGKKSHPQQHNGKQQGKEKKRRGPLGRRR